MGRFDFQPYIGVTGFTKKEEVEAILAARPCRMRRYDLMVGVLASSKTLAGEKNSFPVRFPKVEDIPNIFVDDDEAVNIIHYATKQPENFSEQLFRLVEIAGENLNGFQLNMRWPDPRQIEAFRRRFDAMRIVLQVGAGALAEVEHNPAKLVERVLDYKELIEQILLDPSGGKGIALDVKEMHGYLNALQYSSLIQNIVIAGGLGPDSLLPIQPLVAEFSDLSIDAEGKLRDAEDCFLVEAAKEYVRAAFNLMES